jgi:hypothetical protein
MSSGTKVRVAGIGGLGPTTNQYVLLPAKMTSKSGTKHTFYGEVHIIPHLCCGILLGTSFLRPNHLNIVWAVPGTSEIDHLAAPNRVQIPVGVSLPTHGEPSLGFTTKKVAWPKNRTRRMFAAEGRMIAPGEVKAIPIKDLSLESCPVYEIRPNTLWTKPDIGMNAMIKPETSQTPPTMVTFINEGCISIRIAAGQSLGTVTTVGKSTQTARVYSAIDSPPSPWRKPPDPDLPFILPSGEEPLTAPDVSNHWGNDYTERIRKLVMTYSELFRPGLGMFTDGITMPIPFRDESDITNLKQSPYNLSPRDQQAMNEILDPLVKERRVRQVPLGKPSPAASPAFVVWKEGKPRIVVDLRRNTKLYPDAYPLPKQDQVLMALGGATVFSSMDIKKGFFQQPIDPKDAWKTSFVTPHRGHEHLTVSTMGLANSPGFFQHRIEEILRPYLWKFVVVYVDDILVFSETLEEHYQHLSIVLRLLAESGLTLSLAKCHFIYPDIKLLRHYVGRLGLSTLRDKPEAIKAMKLPTNLRQLETALGFFGYYRKFVPRFAAIAAPLVTLKTRGFKDGPSKGNPRRSHATKVSLERENSDERPTPTSSGGSPLTYTEKETSAWEELKRRLCEAPTLAFPDFSRPFLLYTDGSKEMGFGAALHQIGKDGVEKPILFLSRTLQGAEERYWATELETAALVWALTKLPQFFDAGEFTVFTDHIALKSALQNNPRGRRSNRLNEWAMFLSTFGSRMEIVHRPGKAHNNADGLSRLPRSEHVYPVTLVETSQALKRKIATDLQGDPYFGRIHQAIRTQIENTKADNNGPNTKLHKFRYDPDSGLMFLTDRVNEADRLCIPKTMLRQMLKAAHDDHAHAGVSRTYDRLRNTMFFPRMLRTVREYVTTCPNCQLAKPRNHLPYGDLQPIESPSVPFATLSIDFIVSLPESPEKYTSLLTVTDKFSKFVRLVPGKDTDTAAIWAARFFDQIFQTWGLPSKLISDRDPRFTSSF